MSDSELDPQYAAWQSIAELVRAAPDTPFDDQWRKYAELANERPEELGPMPVWWPDERRIARANISALMADVGVDSYRAFHSWSVEHRAEFWKRVIDRIGIVFGHRPEEMLDLSGGPTAPRWLPGAELNAVDSCFAGSGSATAIVLGREGSPEVDTLTFDDLEALVNRFANGLTEHGFSPGDGIALYMPMNLECVVAYLGSIRAGCHVISIADSFSAGEVSRRLRIGDAAGVVTVDVMTRAGKRIPLYTKMTEASAPRAVVVTSGDGPELRGGDLPWHDLLSDSSTFASVTSDPYTLTNVLFSSGTTGDPKAIPWDHLTPLKAACDGHLHMDLQPGDVVAWPTNVGWMMGPWLIYASLVNRACMALFDGVPSGREFTRFVQESGVSMLGVVPSLVRAWRQSASCDDVDWSRITRFASTGEPSNRPDYLWLMSRTGYRAPVIEYCGGTEIGGGYITGTMVQPACPATFSTPSLGLEMLLLDDRGRPVDDGVSGEVFLVPPSIGLSQSLLNRDHEEVYHKGCPTGPHGEVLRRHGDQMERLPGGYYRALGRADDTMNLGGIKVSSVELETVLAGHEAVAECAAVAVRIGDEGADRLVVFTVLAEQCETAALRSGLGRRIAQRLNPLFKIHDVVIVDALPRTASNKLMRRTLRTRYVGNGRTAG